VLLVGVDDRADKLMPNDIFVIEINESDSGNIFQSLEGLE
jgi:hypothetical protein